MCRGAVHDERIPSANYGRKLRAGRFPVKQKSSVFLLASNTEGRGDTRSHTGVSSPPAMSSARFQDVPVPRRDIVVALLEHAGRSLDADEVARLRSICELLINLYHFEFHAELEAMKRASSAATAASSPCVRQRA